MPYRIECLFNVEKNQSCGSSVSFVVFDKIDNSFNLMCRRVLRAIAELLLRYDVVFDNESIKPSVDDSFKYFVKTT